MFRTRHVADAKLVEDAFEQRFAALPSIASAWRPSWHVSIGRGPRVSKPQRGQLTSAAEQAAGIARYAHRARNGIVGRLPPALA
jgi:hypothetical protein